MENGPCVGPGVERIDPLCFLAGCLKRRLNQALSVFSVSVGFWVCVCCLLRSFFMLTLVCVCMCSVSWLLLVKLSVLAKWLARKTSLSMPLCSKDTKPSQKSAYDFQFIVLFHCVFVFCPLDLHNIFQPWYSLFVLKVPLNTSQPTNHGKRLLKWCMFVLSSKDTAEGWPHIQVASCTRSRVNRAQQIRWLL